MNIIQFLNSKWFFIIMTLVAICLIYAFASINQAKTLNPAIFYQSIGSALAYGTLAAIFFWAIPFKILGWLFSLLTKKNKAIGWATSNNGIILGYVVVLSCLLIAGIEV